MRRKKQDMRLQIRENLRGGKGSIGTLHCFEEDELFGKARLCAFVTLEPGCSIGGHTHVEDAELYVLLEGVLKGTDSGEAVTLHPGDAMMTGGGGSHSIENLSNMPAKLLAVIFK